MTSGPIVVGVPSDYKSPAVLKVTPIHYKVQQIVVNALRCTPQCNANSERLSDCVFAWMGQREAANARFEVRRCGWKTFQRPLRSGGCESTVLNNGGKEPVGICRTSLQDLRGVVPL